MEPVKEERKKMVEITYQLQHPGGGDSAPDDMFFVCCPACGVKIIKVSAGARAENYCPKCGVHLKVGIEGEPTVDICGNTTVATRNEPRRRQKKPNITA